jgi:hypothetical protein
MMSTGSNVRQTCVNRLVQYKDCRNSTTYYVERLLKQDYERALSLLHSAALVYVHVCVSYDHRHDTYEHVNRMVSIEIGRLP